MSEKAETIGKVEIKGEQEIMKENQGGGGTMNDEKIHDCKILKREEFDPLAAELSKVPKERQPQIGRDAAIFVAGMEWERNIEIPVVMPPGIPLEETPGEGSKRRKES